MNVWKDKYSTPEFQEVLDLQKPNILQKAKSYKQIQNTETLEHKHINKSDDIQENYDACSTNMVQTRSKSKTASETILNETQNKQNLQPKIQPISNNKDTGTASIIDHDPSHQTKSGDVYNTDYENLTDPESIHIFIFTINTILKMEYLLKDFEKYHNIFHLTESYLSQPRKTKYTSL